MIPTKEIISDYNEIARGKVNDGVIKTLLLSIMAGVFIAFAGMACSFATSVAGKVVGACVFPMGLIMVVVAGGKLFTGDCLLVMPLMSRHIKFKEMVKTLALVYLGNFIGSVLVAFLVAESGALNGIKTAVIETAVNKSNMNVLDSIIRGILCNVLVCLAVFMSFSTKKVTGKAVLLFIPVFIFVLAGFEHSIANMYFLPAGIFSAIKYGITENLTIMLKGLYANLLPVTLGNIIGGFLVGVIYKVAFSEKVTEENDQKQQ